MKKCHEDAARYVYDHERMREPMLKTFDDLPFAEAKRRILEIEDANGYVAMFGWLIVGRGNAQRGPAPIPEEVVTVGAVLLRRWPSTQPIADRGGEKILFVDPKILVEAQALVAPLGVGLGLMVAPREDA